jgi:hypothetical protein
MSNEEADEESDLDTETKRVQTYIPAYQKEIWSEHADDLGMSRAEYIRTMVMSGRRGFLTGSASDPDDNDTPGVGDAGHAELPPVVRERVLITLRQLETADYDDLAEIVTVDVTEALDAVLDDLQQENVIRHQRDEGYELIADPAGDDGE